jgi:outer membrane lipoprotein-sorting protein
VYEKTYRGRRQDHIRGKTLISRSIADFTTNTQHFLDYEHRLYYESPLSEREQDELKKMARPLEMVRTFFEKGAIARLGRGNVDGIDCYGFEVTYSLGANQSPGAGIVTDRIWVDADNFWPVRLESDIAGATHSPVPDWKMWISEFRWNPMLADTVFAVEIPDDFQVVSRENYRAQMSGE